MGEMGGLSIGVSLTSGLYLVARAFLGIDGPSPAAELAAGLLASSALVLGVLTLGNVWLYGRDPRERDLEGKAQLGAIYALGLCLAVGSALALQVR